MLAMNELILGGARSGKSLLAEQRAKASGRPVIYLATAQAGDGEMTRRIAHHRQRRPADWGCVEETLHLAARLRELAAPDTCVLVDCLTLWLSNLLFAGKAAAQVNLFFSQLIRVAGKQAVCKRGFIFKQYLFYLFE